jgi:hypothetical protein
VFTTEGESVGGSPYSRRALEIGNCGVVLCISDVLTEQRTKLPVIVLSLQATVVVEVQYPAGLAYWD